MTGGIELTLFEFVEKTREGRAHRAKYKYHCQLDKELVFRYEYDPIGHPEMPLHKHVPPDGNRVPWERVGLRSVVDGMWGEIDVERVRRERLRLTA